MTDKILYFPTEGTTGFWFNGVEIVNMEVIGVTEDSMNQCLHIKGKYLKPGDIFDLPDNYEFKEEEKSDGWMGLTKVLRLVKTETKEQPEFNDGRWVLSRHPSWEAYKENYQKSLESCKYLSPEPEESQTVMAQAENAAVGRFKSVLREEIENRISVLKIQNSITGEYTTEQRIKYAIEELEKVVQLLDSVTPKK